MPQDLRQFIKLLQDKAPEEFVTVEREVDSKHEATTLLRKLELEGRRPMVLFKHPKNGNGRPSNMPLVFNTFSSRKKIALALGLTPEQSKMELPRELSKRYAKPCPPIVVDRRDAPVKDIVLKGDQIDLLDLPVPVHHALDGGPYILGGSVIMKDPDTGNYNAAMLRFHVKSAQRATIHAELHHHSGMIAKAYHDRGRACPFAIAIGHHPSFYLGSQWEGPYGRNEFEIIGAAMGEPLRVVPSETWGSDLLVPADAELIIEGETLMGEMDEEGPIGEHTRYYKTIRGGKIEKKFDPLVKPLAITRRRDSFFLSCFLGHAEQGLIGAIPKEAVIFDRVRMAVPGVKAVHLTPAGVSRYICYVSLKQRVAGEAKDAILSAFVSDWHIKFAVAVDEDVDVYSDEEVLWAVATRTQPDRDFFVIPECMGSPLDPTTRIESNRAVTSRMGIDATKPVGEPFSETCEVPLDLLAKIRLEDYLK